MFARKMEKVWFWASWPIQQGTANVHRTMVNYCILAHTRNWVFALIRSEEKASCAISAPVPYNEFIGP